MLKGLVFAGSDMMASSRLLKLPAEIRSLIFEYAVACQQRVTFLPDELQRQYYSIATQPPLTRVNRQIRAESLPIYYESNDFVLHTESPKADDARRWLICNADYLRDLRRISLWLRYVPPPNERSASSGALGVALVRPHHSDPWLVDEVWRWITVTRKPHGLTDDANFVLEKLQSIIGPVCKESATPQEYMGLMMDLRMFYIQKKMS